MSLFATDQVRDPLYVDHIVSVQGDRFLGHGGGLVREYPDARVFKTKSSARVAAAVVRVAHGIGAREISCAAYAEGDES